MSRLVFHSWTTAYDVASGSAGLFVPQPWWADFIPEKFEPEVALAGTAARAGTCGPAPACPLLGGGEAADGEDLADGVGEVAELRLVGDATLRRAGLGDQSAELGDEVDVPPKLVGSRPVVSASTSSLAVGPAYFSPAAPV